MRLLRYQLDEATDVRSGGRHVLAYCAAAHTTHHVLAGVRSLCTTLAVVPARECDATTAFGILEFLQSSRTEQTPLCSEVGLGPWPHSVQCARGHTQCGAPAQARIPPAIEARAARR